MQPMWLYLFSDKQFEDTFENAQWGKVKQMQPMWLCLFSDRPFEETFENAHWKKLNKCILSGRQVYVAFENAAEESLHDQWKAFGNTPAMHVDINVDFLNKFIVYAV